MKPNRITALLAGLLLALTIAIPTCTLTGCATFGQRSPAIAYHTLRDTQILVDSGMKVYADRCVAGRITAADQAKVDAAHATYRQAFREAVTLAQLDYSKLTPDNVEALANALLKLIAGL